MFDRLRNILDRNKGARSVNSDFLRPKDEPARTASVVTSDRKGPLPAAMLEKPPVISLPGVTSAVSRPMEELKPLAPPLPADIDPEQVAIVRHDTKKVSGERFRYVDKPLKPLDGEARRADVIKYNDKHGADVIKYKAAPVHVKENEKPVAEVFKYKPVRVEIKS